MYMDPFGRRLNNGWVRPDPAPPQTVSILTGRGNLGYPGQGLLKPEDKKD